MTPIPVTPAAPPPMPGGDGSLYSLIGDALKDDSPTSQADTPITAEPVAEPPVTEPEVTSDAPAESSTEPAAVETQPETPALAEDDDEELDKPALDALLATPRGKRIYAGYKYSRELSKPSSEGGIGHVPTVEQARDYFRSYTDLMMMESDINSGEPEKIGRFIDHVFGQLPDGSFRENVEAVAEQLPTALAKNAGAYTKAATGFLNNYSSALWERCQVETDPKRKEALWAAAQILHNDLTGMWRTQDQPNGQAPAVDPRIAADRQALDRDRQQLQTEKKALAEAKTKEWNTSVDSSIRSSMDKALDEALSPLKTLRDKTPKIYAALRRDFHDQVRAQVSKDPEAWRLFNIRADQARRAGTPDAISTIAQEYMKLAQTVIQRTRKSFLQEAGVAVKQQSDQRHEVLGNIASNTAPTTNGTPSPQSPGNNMARRPGETHDDYVHRLVKEAL